MVQSRRFDFKITVYYFIVIFWTIQLMSATTAATTTTKHLQVSTMKQSNRSFLFIRSNPIRVQQKQQQKHKQQKLLYRSIPKRHLYQQSITKHKQHKQHEQQQQDLSFDTFKSAREHKLIPLQQQQLSIMNHQMITHIRHVVYTFIFVAMVTTLSSFTTISSAYALDMEAFAAQQLLDSPSSSSSSSPPPTTSRSSTSTSTTTGSDLNYSIKTASTNDNDDTMTTTTTMSTDEALCRFSQPGLIKGDACVRAGISIENKKDPKNGVNAYGQINRGSYTKCYKEYTLVNTGTNANEKPYWQSEWICQ